MNIDFLAAIELTASAVVATSVLAVGLGDSAARRVRLAAGFGAWFVAVAILALTSALHDERGAGAPALGLAVGLPIVVLSFMFLRSPHLRAALDAVPLSLLIGVNALRVLGVLFVAAYAAGRLPGPFAPVAGWGDIFVGLAAIPVALIAHRRGSAAVPLVLAWNTLGLADLVAAVTLGVTSSPGPLRLIFNEPGAALMTTAPWLLIPGFLVPLFASTHLAVFYRLRQAHRTAPAM